MVMEVTMCPSGENTVLIAIHLKCIIELEGQFDSI